VDASRRLDAAFTATEAAFHENILTLLDECKVKNWCRRISIEPVAGDSCPTLLGPRRYPIHEVPVLMAQAK
jgi:hypothetical protein